MFLTGKITLNAYTDSAETASPLENLPLITKEFTADDLVGAQPTVLSLAAGASQVISLNGIGAVKGLYLFSDGEDVNVNMNALGNLLFSSGYPAFLPATITTLTITNASATTATNVTLTLLGY